MCSFQPSGSILSGWVCSEAGGSITLGIFILASTTADVSLTNTALEKGSTPGTEDLFCLTCFQIFLLTLLIQNPHSVQMRAPQATSWRSLLWKVVLLWKSSKSTYTTSRCLFRPVAITIDLPVLRCLSLTFFLASLSNKALHRPNYQPESAQQFVL